MRRLTICILLTITFGIIFNGNTQDDLVTIALRTVNTLDNQSTTHIKVHQAFREGLQNGLSDKFTIIDENIYDKNTKWKHIVIVDVIEVESFTILCVNIYHRLNPLALTNKAREVFTMPIVHLPKDAIPVHHAIFTKVFDLESKCRQFAEDISIIFPE